jgi:hypothetical protein
MEKLWREKSVKDLQAEARADSGLKRALSAVDLIAPWVPVVPLLGIACCLYLAVSLPFEAWLRLLFWLIIGLVIYFLYGVRHSRLSLK